MKKAVSLVAALLIFRLPMGCTVTRPEQDNFLVDASRTGGATLARELASSLRAILTTSELAFPDSDKVQMFSLRGDGFTLDLSPLPDDRCNPHASRHSTYYEQMFRADLVYNKTRQSDKDSIKKRFIAGVQILRVPIAPFSECP